MAGYPAIWPTTKAFCSCSDQPSSVQWRTMMHQILWYLWLAVKLMPLAAAIILARVLLELSPKRWQTFGKMLSTFLVVELLLILLGYARASLIVSVLTADFFGWIHVR